LVPPLIFFPTKFARGLDPQHPLWATLTIKIIGTHCRFIEYVFSIVARLYCSVITAPNIFKYPNF
jgi:hypothetical protein